MKRGIVLGVAATCLVISGWVPAPRPSAAAAPVSAPYIVQLRDGTNPAVHARTLGAAPRHLYRSAIVGYASDLTAVQVRRAQGDPSVTAVVPDAVISMPRQRFEGVDLPEQRVSNGVRRIGGLESPTAAIDGVDGRVDVDVAVLDSGVDVDHPDLNVAGGVDCAFGKGYDDIDGHGTMVAGFVGALDNAYGRVGVAPGARIWAVKVVNPKRGTVSKSALLCGVEWVTEHAATIEVANLSLAGKWVPESTCDTVSDSWHRAICASVARGVTYVVAAGNEAVDANTPVPAKYPEVITVSALADTDGLPGGTGASAPCWPDQVDDTFATFSNFGSVVDIAAPGVCIGSTFLNGLYAIASGTSFATPLVSGAAALYLTTHPEATPAQVQAALIATREQTSMPGDPDGIDEGILNVSGL